MVCSAQSLCNDANYYAGPAAEAEAAAADIAPAATVADAVVVVVVPLT